MDQMNEQYFPTEFILDYAKQPAGKNRLLTYTIFRFLSFADPKGETLPLRLRDALSLNTDTISFSTIEAYLAEDYYFSPSFTAGSLEPFYLTCAITLCKEADALRFLDTLLVEFCPVIAGISYQNTSLDLAALLMTGTDFYGALYLALTQAGDTVAEILPKFTEAYREEYHFTCEDYILFDFMDEYFEQKNCRLHPSFIEMTDTLVAATLNYHNTDFGTILEMEIAQNLSGTGSRFAGIKRFASIQLPTALDRDKDCHMLAELFRYAAVYELRNNLFDFHLEDDKLIPLDNWKEQLHWHYVQYSNVYEMALASFHAAMLSKALLKEQFDENIRRVFSK